MKFFCIIVIFLSINYIAIVNVFKSSAVA
ncbi:TPA: hypothetical protein ACHU3J_004639, partial [Shigella flexneri]